MITNSHRKHMNTSFPSFSRMRDNIRSVFTEYNVLILYILSDETFHNGYYRFNVYFLTRFHSFLCTFANHISYDRMFLYLSRKRDFLNIRFRQNRINSTNFYASRNMGNNVFIRSMVLVPLLLGISM